MATRLRGESLTVPHTGQALNYAVTATDRYGNESSPVYTKEAAHTQPKVDFRELIMGKPKAKTASKSKAKSKTKPKRKKR